MRRTDDHERADPDELLEHGTLERVVVEDMALHRAGTMSYRLGRHTRNPASTSHGPLRSGVDLFGRASRGLYRTLSDIVRAQNTSNIVF